MSGRSRNGARGHNGDVESLQSGDRERLRQEAHAWVARLAPLLVDDPAATEAELRERIARLEELHRTLPDVFLLKSSVDEEDQRLLGTVEKAARQLPNLEEGLRRRLALLAPGDPQSRVDLEQVQERLAELEAREELGLKPDVVPTGSLELKTSPGNLQAGAFLGVFGLGWTAFTTVHAFFMIGGMWRAFGPLALALLLFYAIFWAVGFGMLSMALATAADESIRLDGNLLTVRRAFGPFVRERTYVVDTKRPARVERVSGGASESGRTTSMMKAVVLTDADGRPILLAAGTTSSKREEVVRRINAYLAAQNG